MTSKFASNFRQISQSALIINSNHKYAIDIRIRDSIPTKVSAVKFLGVTLDKNLTFNDHVKNFTTKISLFVL